MTREQAALIKKARESLRGARLLAKEELYDFAASRAYYAMFYLAEAFLLGDNIAYSKHSAVISAFGRKFAKAGRVPAEFHRYLIVQFFFNETKSTKQVSRFWLRDSHFENPVVGFEKRLPYLPQDQRSGTDPYLDIPP